MASLDYAYLADYAQVNQGKLTTVGASFTHVLSPVLPSQLQFAIAGRIRTHVDAEPTELGFEISSPAHGVHLSVGGTIAPSAEDRPYDGGKVGLLFSVGLTHTLNAAGLYKVEISVDGELARTLAFEVETIEPANAG